MFVSKGKQYNSENNQDVDYGNTDTSGMCVNICSFQAVGTVLRAPPEQLANMDSHKTESTMITTKV